MPVRVRGFSLMETLVALVILSVAALGLLAVFARSLSEMRGALFHSRAVELAGDLAEHLRTHGAIYHMGLPSAESCLSNPSPRCDADNALVLMLAAWRDRVTNRLPLGRGDVVRDEHGASGRYRVVVSWVDPGRGYREHNLELAVGTQ